MGEKEYDPVMHTAEHLVNGAIARRLACGRAFSTHIEKKKSKCDFRYPHNLTPEALLSIEQQVNGQIAADVEVSDQIMDFAEASAQYTLARLPEGVETVRIVHIGPYDSCPCIGTHVSRTSEIPPVKMISSDCSDGVLRVRFKLQKS